MHLHKHIARSIGMLLCTACLATAPAAAQSVSTASPSFSITRFQSQIDDYLKVDAIAPPAPGGIVFVGSSIFRLWSTLTEQMASLPVYNRAFGGSRTPEMLYYMDKIVVPYKPRFVVYYCGSNDVSGRDSTIVVVARIKEFHRRILADLPGTRMFFVSILRSPEKRQRWAVVDSINAQLRHYAATARDIEYIDVNPMLLDSAGALRGELYRSDSLHYNPPAYVLFTSVIKPVLERAWNSRR